ncbi:LTA synthase family protein, partial [Collinsella aerofaciens]|nr:LTA synthase family protein [Collinsella aerofaciens]
DEFLSIEDFAGALVYHSGATDVFTYDKIIELLERDAAPQFIIDVTMQNHSGYGEGTVPSEDAVQLDVAGVDDQR